MMELSGAPAGTVEALARSASVAGLEVVQSSGFFTTLVPELGFELHAATAGALRERAIKSGTGAERIDDLTLNLRAAKRGDYQWVSSPFFLDLALRKPTV